MRIAYIGLSSPLAYYYDHHRNFTALQEWHWNPIIESPVGLVTLFDEIWFLHRALCPLTMRREPFVRFLNEDSDITELIQPFAKSIRDRDDPEFGARMEELDEVVSEQTQMFADTIRLASGMVPGRECPIDCHSHMMRLGDTPLSGSSWSSRHLAFDLLAVEQLSGTTSNRVELVTNTFTDACLPACPTTGPETEVTHEILVSRIPVLQTREGPVLEGIGRVRNNDYLAAFRAKLGTDAGQISREEIESTVAHIENEYGRYKVDVLLEHQAAAGLLTSIARNVFSALVPYVTEVGDLITSAETRRMNWTAFLASVDSQTTWPTRRH